MDVLEALSEQTAVRHVTTRHEQGAAFMADVYGRLTGRAAVAMATLGPGCDQPRDRHRRRVPGPRADGRHHRPDRARQAPQGGAPVRRHRPHVRARDQVEPARRATGGGARDRAQGVPRRPAREARPDPHRAPREPRGRDRRRRHAPDRTHPDLFPGADRRGHRPCRPAAGRLEPAARPGRQRRPPPERGAGPARPRHRPPPAGRRDVHGQGRARRPQPPVAHGGRPPGPRSRADRLRSVGPRGVRRLRPGRIRPVTMEPRRPQADHPHRYAAGRGRRVLPARGRARRRHRRDAAPVAAGHAAARHRRPGRERPARHARDARPPGPAHGAARRARGVRARRRLADQAAEGDRRPAPRARTEGHRGQRRRRAQDLGRAPVPGLRAEHGDHLERLRRDGHLAARARSRPSWSIPSGASSRCAATAGS